MKLSDYSIQREKVPLPGKAVNGEKPFFEVRGLNLTDMTFLVQRHLAPITKALKLWQESREDVLRTGNLSQFVMTVIQDFPELAAEVISAASDDPTDKAAKVAGQLPIATQIVALNAIAKLSVEDGGGLKNLLAEMQDRLKDVVSVGDQSQPARPKTN